MKKTTIRNGAINITSMEVVSVNPIHQRTATTNPRNLAKSHQMQRLQILMHEIESKFMAQANQSYWESRRREGYANKYAKR